MLSKSDTNETIMYRLRDQHAESVRIFPVLPGDSGVGRSAVNEIVIPHPSISRRHARLSLGSDGLELRDLNSRNGTRVNGREVRQGEVVPGDTLELGSVSLRLEKADAADIDLAVGVGGLEETHPVAKVMVNGGPMRPPPPMLSQQVAHPLVFPPAYLPGKSTAATALHREMQSLLQTELPVLIEGETGVGKEQVARTLHLSSGRAALPFVAVNCAAIPRDLLEAEMFGIGRGVATGVTERPGKFREAAGGTLFLDELGEMPLEVQPKLLRALQEKRIQPVGGSDELPVDIWVLAASNKSLWELTEAGRFRRDLYYRVAGTVITVPALRLRRDDIPFLIEHFLRLFTAETGKRIHGPTAKAMRTLMEQPWEGNVRELEHQIRRLACLCRESETIDSALLSEHLVLPGSAVRSFGSKKTEAVLGFSAHQLPPAEQSRRADETSLRLKDHVRDTELQIIVRALAVAGASQPGAAKLLGISRTTLARKIADLHIA